jgi:hypothetical protein
MEVEEEKAVGNAEAAVWLGFAGIPLPIICSASGS